MVLEADGCWPLDATVLVLAPLPIVSEGAAEDAFPVEVWLEVFAFEPLAPDALLFAPPDALLPLELPFALELVTALPEVELVPPEIEEFLVWFDVPDELWPDPLFEGGGVGAADSLMVFVQAVTYRPVES